jgi:hypothetical protein
LFVIYVKGKTIDNFQFNKKKKFHFRHSSQNQTKCKTQNTSNSSFIHEELQHSLMKHLYHEQTNTISSTSTSSSSSQSKSNDTTTTSNLFQLSPPCSNLNPTTLCFRNPHIGSDQIDYHVYETIPSENMTYTLCTTHNAFKSNTQFPRTNILYHHPDSSKQTYDTLSKISPNTMVVLPVCCHQCSTGTLRQIYTRSESIV